MKKFIYILLFSLVLHAQWYVDFDQALVEAKKQKKYMLVHFEESDGCPWCLQFKQKILTHPKFLQFAIKHFVLCHIDFPLQKPIPHKLKQKNYYLKKHYQVKVYPKVLFIDHNKKAFFKIGFRKEGDMQEYMSLLKKIVYLQNSFKTLAQFKNFKTSYLLKTVVLWDSIPKQARLLKSQFAYLIFWQDKENKLGRRFEAAYAIAMYSKEKNKEKYVSFLRNNLANDSKRHYERLLGAYFANLTRQLALVYRKVKVQKQQQSRMLAMASYILKELKQTKVPMQNSKEIFRLLTAEALCYRCYNKEDKLKMVWKKMLKIIPDHPRIPELKKFLQIK